MTRSEKAIKFRLKLLRVTLASMKRSVHVSVFTTMIEDAQSRIDELKGLLNYLQSPPKAKKKVKK